MWRGANRLGAARAPTPMASDAAEGVRLACEVLRLAARLRERGARGHALSRWVHRLQRAASANHLQTDLELSAGADAADSAIASLMVSCEHFHVDIPLHASDEISCAIGLATLSHDSSTIPVWPHADLKALEDDVNEPLSAGEVEECCARLGALRTWQAGMGSSAAAARAWRDARDALVATLGPQGVRGRCAGLGATLHDTDPSVGRAEKMGEGGGQIELLVCVRVAAGIRAAPPSRKRKADAEPAADAISAREIEIAPEIELLAELSPPLVVRADDALVAHAEGCAVDGTGGAGEGGRLLARLMGGAVGGVGAELAARTQTVPMASANHAQRWALNSAAADGLGGGGRALGALRVGSPADLPALLCTLRARAGWARVVRSAWHEPLLTGVAAGGAADGACAPSGTAYWGVLGDLGAAKSACEYCAELTPLPPDAMTVLAPLAAGSGGAGGAPARHVATRLRIRALAEPPPTIGRSGTDRAPAAPRWEVDICHERDDGTWTDTWADGANAPPGAPPVSAALVASLLERSHSLPLTLAYLREHCDSRARG